MAAEKAPPTPDEPSATSAPLPPVLVPLARRGRLRRLQFNDDLEHRLTREDHVDSLHRQRVRVKTRGSRRFVALQTSGKCDDPIRLGTVDFCLDRSDSTCRPKVGLVIPTNLQVASAAITRVGIEVRQNDKLMLHGRQLRDDHRRLDFAGLRNVSWCGLKQFNQAMRRRTRARSALAIGRQGFDARCLHRFAQFAFQQRLHKQSQEVDRKQSADPPDILQICRRHCEAPLESQKPLFRSGADFNMPPKTCSGVSAQSLTSQGNAPSSRSAAERTG